MLSYESILQDFNCKLDTTCTKYPQIGLTYRFDRDDCKGIYWAYESAEYIIDIHDAYILQDMVLDGFSSLESYMQFVTAYLIQVKGRFVDSKTELRNQSLFVSHIHHKVKYILEKGHACIIFGIKYKQSLLRKMLNGKGDVDKLSMQKFFWTQGSLVHKSIEKIIHEITHCKMDILAAKLFMDAKAIEWLSLCLDSYLNEQTQNTLSRTDKDAIQIVCTYIEKHYNEDIRLETLSKIACMSISKLKNCFRAANGMCITEYLQRSRIHAAEEILQHHDRSIAETAKMVGYQSAGRFSALFKRYLGRLPKEVKKEGKSI